MRNRCPSGANGRSSRPRARTPIQLEDVEIRLSMWRDGGEEQREGERKTGGRALRYVCLNVVLTNAIDCPVFLFYFIFFPLSFSLSFPLSVSLSLSLSVSLSLSLDFLKIPAGQ